jgi:hypothetical protein
VPIVIAPTEPTALIVIRILAFLFALVIASGNRTRKKAGRFLTFAQCGERPQR